MNKIIRQNEKGFGIVIVAHGALADAYRDTLAHVIGPVDFVRTIRVENHDKREDKCHDILKAADEVDTGHGVVMVTDMFGGTPSNLAVLCSKRQDYEVIYGVNMPALVSLAKARKYDLKKALEMALCAGGKYMGISPRR